MKKQNLIIIILAIFCILILPNKVSAQEPNTAENWKVMCARETVSKTESVNCYLLATINGSIYGVYTSIETIDKLIIDGYFSGDDALFPVTKINKGEQTGLNTQCTGDGNCYDFLSKGETADIKSNTDNSKYNDYDFTTNYSAYTVVGYWTVRLSEDATDENCGKLCVKINYKSTKAGSPGDPGVPSIDNGQCAEIHPTVTPVCRQDNGKFYGKDGTEVTEEEYNKQCSKSCYKGEDGTYYDKNGQLTTEEQYIKECDPETGSFASYAVLAAGAFIALSAITIAKKHNKFYKI